MLSFFVSVVVVCRAVPLKPAQHAALMTIYNKTGVETVDHPRFLVAEDCVGEIVCADGNVIHL